MASGPFTLAQLAQAVGMSVDDVQFYRHVGLLPPPRRQRTRTDDVGFHAEHVDRLRFIQRAIAFGFFLEDIQRFLDETSLVTCNDVYHIALHRLEEYRRARSSGHPTVVALERLIASCAGKGSRKDCQILATLSKREPEDEQL
jgi:DNA-binding transcriptional MerR regulator